MWEGRPIENGNDWSNVFGCGAGMSTSMVVSSSSPKLYSREGPSCSTLERRRHSEMDKPKMQDEMLVPPVHEDQSSAGNDSWQLLSVTLLRVPSVGFGIAVSGGRDNPHFTSGDPAVVVSDVVPSGPAWGLVQVNDRILVANGVSLENAEYAAAVKIMKESQQLNMIVKRRAPVPLIEFEQRTLKFTLSKTKAKKEDFGIVLGCKFYIKDITNRKLAEKEPGLKEGDIVQSINGESLDGLSFEEATKLLHKSREKLSLVVQRDVRRGGSRWPSQNTVYERLGSVSATPRHSPSPMLNSHQVVAPRSSLEYGNRSTSPNTRWSQSDHPSHDYGEYYRRNGSVSSSQGCHGENDVRVVKFRKVGGSLGVRVIGGNQVGIFVSAVQPDSPAALNSIRTGDRILAVNDKAMAGVTREEAVRHLLALSDDVTIRVEHAPAEFEQIRTSQLGDSFYIRTHFANQKVTNQLELTFHNGDIFHVTDTLFGGTVGLWQATRVYSAAQGTSHGPSEGAKGVIPNLETAETLAKAARVDSSTLGRTTFFRRKLKERRTKSLTKNAMDEIAFSDSNYEMTFPAYERVTLRHPNFQRPVVLYGPLADVARQLLLTNFALRFAGAGDDTIVRLSSIDAIINANKHCVLDVSPGSVERLQLAQYAPIVILIDVEGRGRIRELRSRAGAPSLSSRKLIEQANKIKKYHSHLLTATLDATKEDGWFDALRQLIAHLQDRRVWMPEFRPSANLSDVILLPMQNFQNQSDSDVDSLKGEYSGSDYITRNQLQAEKECGTFRSIYDPHLNDYGGLAPKPLHAAHSQPQTGYAGNNFMGYSTGSSYYQNMHDSEPIAQFASRVPLQTSNQAVAMLDSPARRALLDVSSTSSGIPWATLPRRYHHGSASNSPAFNAPNNQQNRLTTVVRQQSPSSGRFTPQSRAAVMKSPVAQKVQCSPAKSPVAAPDSLPHCHRSNSPILPTTGFSQNVVTDSKVLHQPQGSPGYYDVKQILAEQSSDYYGPESTTEPPRSHYQNAEAAAYGIRHRPQYTQDPLPAQRSGLFYDHLTRGRWGGGSHNERRQASVPAHLSQHRAALRASPVAPVTQSPIMMNDGNIRYADESPKSRQEHANSVSSNVSESVGIKSPRVIESDQLTDSDRMQTSVISEKATDDLSEKDKGRTNESEPTVIEHVSGVVDSAGGTLSCPQSGVMLIIPRGAISEGVHQEIYVKVCRANGEESRPPLDESRGESLMSPLVMCGPQDLQFNVPVELRLPHSASNNGENWSFALKSGTGEQWNQISLDESASSVVTDKFVSVKISHF